jgi:hypothetical protein
MGGKLVASVAIYVAPERSFGAGALDDERVPGPASRCALQQACAALGQQAGPARSPRSPKTAVDEQIGMIPAFDLGNSKSTT